MESELGWEREQDAVGSIFRIGGKVAPDAAVGRNGQSGLGVWSPERALDANWMLVGAGPRLLYKGSGGGPGNGILLASSLGSVRQDFFP